MSKPVLNKNYTEDRIVLAIRRLGNFDKLEISYDKAGQLRWQVTHVERGVYSIPLDNETP